MCLMTWKCNFRIIIVVEAEKASFSPLILFASKLKDLWWRLDNTTRDVLSLFLL